MYTYTYVFTYSLIYSLTQRFALHFCMRKCMHMCTCVLQNIHIMRSYIGVCEFRVYARGPTKVAGPCKRVLMHQRPKRWKMEAR